MTIKNTYYIIILFACLSVLPHTLRAQGYQVADELPYHASSVYFLILENPDGQNVNSLYSSTAGAIGAFVDGELRGSSQWQPTGTAAGQGFFFIRVWGDKEDPASVTFRLHDTSGQEQMIGTQPFAQGLEGTYGTPSNPIRLTVKEPEVPEVTLAFAVQSLTASKLRDTELTLTRFGSATFLPSKVELVFNKADNGDPVATATMADDSGMKWMVRGVYAGQHSIRIKYNGKEQTSACQLNIPAEYPIEPGWNWLSFYAIVAGDSYPLKSGDNYVGLSIDEDNFISDIRTQTGVLHYDVQLGYVGNLSVLSASDGAIKILGKYEDNATQRIILNAGYENLLKGSNLPMPQVKSGYTWVNYPHEISHSIDDLSAYLSKTAADGDMLIGRDGFALFNGEEWIASSDFRLEPGHGYIYYSESPALRYIDWGINDPSILPAPRHRARCIAEETSPWNCQPGRYPDCMPVVACLKGIDHPEDYAIGAFVGEECRGKGEVVGSEGLLFVAVSGQRGDQVTFRLYNKATATVTAIPDTEVGFIGHIGNSYAPLQLSPSHIAIEETDTDGQSVPTVTVYDLQGRRITSTSSLRRGLSIVTVTKGDHRVTRKIISK